MNPPVTFNVVSEPSGLRALLETSVFSLSDMNVMLSHREVVISLIDPVIGEVGFRRRVAAPEAQRFTGFDISESTGKLMVHLFLDQES